jgi:tetratricopeptide (TPR) repeat protein
MGVALIAAFAIIVPVQRKLDDGEDSSVLDEELLYLPNERLLVHFTAGLHSVVADVLWLRCVQYTAKEFHSQEHKFTWLEHMTQTITRLDPYFADVYRYGGTLLAAIGAPRPALNLLREGVRNRPDRWELPYEIANVYILNLREEEGAATAASYYLSMAAERNPEHRDFLMQWAYRIQVKENLQEEGKRVWQTMLATSGSRMMRELAARKLSLLEVTEIVELLNTASESYEEQEGRPPRSLRDLAEAGLVQGRPPDPLGGQYFVGPEGEVYSTTLLDDDKAERLRVIQRAVDGYVDEFGSPPDRLQDVIDQGFIKGLPPHPYPSRTWQYDPETGAVS